MGRDKSRRTNRDRDYRYRDSNRERSCRSSKQPEDASPPTFLLIFTFLLAVLSGALFVYVSGPPYGSLISFANPFSMFQASIKNHFSNSAIRNENQSIKVEKEKDKPHSYETRMDIKAHLNRHDNWRKEWQLKHQQRQMDIKNQNNDGLTKGANKDGQFGAPRARRTVIRDHVGRIVEPLTNGEEDLGERNVKPAYFIQSSWQDNSQGRAPNSIHSSVANPYSMTSHREADPASLSGPGSGPLSVQAPKGLSFSSTRGILSTSTDGRASKFTIVRDPKSMSHFGYSSSKGTPVEAEQHQHVAYEEEKQRESHKKPVFKGCTVGLEGTDGMVGGYNITRISHALYKVMRLFGFSSLSDAPAGAHIEWIGELARQLAFEMPRFRYTAIDKSPERLAQVERVLRNVVDGDFLSTDIEHLHLAQNGQGNRQQQQQQTQRHQPHTDLLFYWPELDGKQTDPGHASYPRHIRIVMASAKEAGIGYMIVAQYPSMNGPLPTYKHGKWIFVDDNAKNVDPFLLNVYIRGAVPMSGTGTSKPYVIYLTFYSLRSIPLSSLQV